MEPTTIHNFVWMNEKGQSMVAALTAASISLTALTGSMNLVDFSLKGSQLVSSKADLNSVSSLIQLVLADKNSCLDSLKMNGRVPYFLKDQSSVGLTSVDFNGSTLLSPGQSLGNLRVKDITLSKEGKGPNYIGTLRVGLERVGSGLGGPPSDQKFYLKLKTDGEITETLSSCSGEAASNGLQLEFNEVEPFPCELEKSGTIALTNKNKLCVCSKSDEWVFTDSPQKKMFMEL